MPSSVASRIAGPLRSLSFRRRKTTQRKGKQAQPAAAPSEELLVASHGTTPPSSAPHLQSPIPNSQVADAHGFATPVRAHALPAVLQVISGEAWVGSGNRAAHADLVSASLAETAEARTPGTPVRTPETACSSSSADLLAAGDHTARVASLTQTELSDDDRRMAFLMSRRPEGGELLCATVRLGVHVAKSPPTGLSHEFKAGFEHAVGDYLHSKASSQHEPYEMMHTQMLVQLHAMEAAILPTDETAASDATVHCTPRAGSLESTQQAMATWLELVVEIVLDCSRMPGEVLLEYEAMLRTLDSNESAWTSFLVHAHHPCRLSTLVVDNVHMISSARQLATLLLHHEQPWWAEGLAALDRAWNMAADAIGALNMQEALAYAPLLEPDTASIDAEGETEQPPTRHDALLSYDSLVVQLAMLELQWRAQRTASYVQATMSRLLDNFNQREERYRVRDAQLKRQGEDALTEERSQLTHVRAMLTSQSATAAHYDEEKGSDHGDSRSARNSDSARPLSPCLPVAIIMMLSAACAPRVVGQVLGAAARRLHLTFSSLWLTLRSTAHTARHALNSIIHQCQHGCRVFLVHSYGTAVQVRARMESSFSSGLISSTRVLVRVESRCHAWCSALGYAMEQRARSAKRGCMVYLVHEAARLQWLAPATEDGTDAASRFYAPSVSLTSRRGSSTRLGPGAIMFDTIPEDLEVDSRGLQVPEGRSLPPLERVRQKSCQTWLVVIGMRLSIRVVLRLTQAALILVRASVEIARRMAWVLLITVLFNLLSVWVAYIHARQAMVPPPPPAVPPSPPKVPPVPPTPPVHPPKPPPSPRPPPPPVHPSPLSPRLEFDKVNPILHFDESMVLNGHSCLHSEAGQAAHLPVDTSPFTIAAWIKPSRHGNPHGGIVGWGQYGEMDGVNAFRLEGFDRVASYMWNDDLRTDFVPGLDLADGHWHHVATTFDGQRRQIFIDFQQLASRSSHGPVALHTTDHFCVGLTSQDEFFEGTIQDLRIWDAAVSFGVHIAHPSPPPPPQVPSIMSTLWSSPMLFAREHPEQTNPKSAFAWSSVTASLNSFVSSISSPSISSPTGAPMHFRWEGVTDHSTDVKQSTWLTADVVMHSASWILVLGVVVVIAWKWGTNIISVLTRTTSEAVAIIRTRIVAWGSSARNITRAHQQHQKYEVEEDQEMPCVKAHPNRNVEECETVQQLSGQVIRLNLVPSSATAERRRGIVIADFQAVEGAELSVQCNALVTLLDSSVDYMGWLYVQVDATTEKGLVPESHVQILDPADAQNAHGPVRLTLVQVSKDTTSRTNGLVLADFVAVEDAELTVRRNARVTIIDDRSVFFDWIYVVDHETGNEGLVPKTYVRTLEESVAGSHEPEPVRSVSAVQIEANGTPRSGALSGVSSGGVTFTSWFEEWARDLCAPIEHLQAYWQQPWALLEGATQKRDGQDRRPQASCRSSLESSMGWPETWTVNDETAGDEVPSVDHICHASPIAPIASSPIPVPLLEMQKIMALSQNQSIIAHRSQRREESQQDRPHYQTYATSRVAARAPPQRRTNLAPAVAAAHQSWHGTPEMAPGKPARERPPPKEASPPRLVLNSGSSLEALREQLRRVDANAEPLSARSMYLARRSASFPQSRNSILGGVPVHKSGACTGRAQHVHAPVAAGSRSKSNATMTYGPGFGEDVGVVGMGEEPDFLSDKKSVQVKLPEVRAEILRPAISTPSAFKVRETAVMHVRETPVMSSLGRHGSTAASVSATDLLAEIQRRRAKTHQER